MNRLCMRIVCSIIIATGLLAGAPGASRAAGQIERAVIDRDEDVSADEWPAQFIPPDALAYARFDPGGFRPGALAALPLALGIIERGGVVDPELHPLIDAITAAAVAGSTPHTICVLDADAIYDETAANGFRMERLQLVVSLDSPRGQRTHLQTLANILSHYGAESEGNGQTPFTLPDGAMAMRFRDAEWSEWQTIEWASSGESLLIGMGEGSLARWTRAQRERPQQLFLDRHRAESARGADDDSTGAGEQTFLEIWINFDRLHEIMPDILAQGRVRRTLVTWKLDNARNWMMIGRWSGRFLLFDLSWQRRSEPREIVARRALSLDHWPRDLAADAPDDEFIAIFPADLAGAFEQVIGAWAALRGDSARDEIERAMRAYRARFRTVYEPMWRSFEPWIIVTGDPPSPVPVPGAMTFRFILREGQPQGRAASRVNALISTIIHNEDDNRSQRAGDIPAADARPRIRTDRASEMAWVEWDSNGWLRAPAWGWVDRAFVISWGPAALVEMRTDDQGK